MTLDNLCPEDVFEELRLRGAVAATVVFSGGHDEGGADDIYLWRSATYHSDDSVNMSESDALPFPWQTEIVRQPFDEDPGDPWSPAPEYFQKEGQPTLYQQWKQPPGSNAEFAESLYQMVAAKYGSWAGEFRANGEVTWNLERYDEDHPDSVIMQSTVYNEVEDFDSESWGPQ